MGTEEVVIDSSAALAFLKGEPGGERLRAYLPKSYMSAVNAAEVVQVLIRYGIDPDRGLDALQKLGLRIADANLAVARAAGILESGTRDVGLSLGDRFCFALALEKSLKVIATDNPFSRTRLPVATILLR